jgi:type IX secretion system PorP/SprF family membrane protein
MKKVFTILTIILAMAAAPSAIGQDMHFSQFYSSPVTINPAATGAMKEDLRFTSFYRDQWRSLGSPYKTMLSSFDAKIFTSRTKSNSFGLGMQVYSDKAGESRMGVSLANLSLSYNIKINRYHNIGAGLQAGAGQRSIQLNNLRWDSQFDGDIFDPSRPGEYIPVPNLWMVDFSGGLYWTHQRDENFSANGGIAVYHMNKPDQSFYGTYRELLYTRIVMHGGAEFGIDHSNTAILPSFLFMKQGPSHEIMAGALVKYKLGVDSKYTNLNTSSAFYLGAFYRVRDAISLATRFDFRNNWSVGFNYDVNVSKLRMGTSGRGGMEVSLVWKGVTSQTATYKLKK